MSNVYPEHEPTKTGYIDYNDFNAVFNPRQPDDVHPKLKPLIGKVLTFRYGWIMEDDEPYPGEIAYRCVNNCFLGQSVSGKDLERIKTCGKVHNDGNAIDRIEIAYDDDTVINLNLEPMSTVCKDPVHIESNKKILLNNLSRLDDSIVDTRDTLAQVRGNADVSPPMAKISYLSVGVAISVMSIRKIMQSFISDGESACIEEAVVKGRLDRAALDTLIAECKDAAMRLRNNPGNVAVPVSLGNGHGFHITGDAFDGNISIAGWINNLNLNPIRISYILFNDGMEKLYIANKEILISDWERDSAENKRK